MRFLGLEIQENFALAKIFKEKNMSEHIVKLATERNFNKNTFPVLSIKGKSLPEYPIYHEWNGLRFVCEAGTFAEKERMIMDIICTDIIHNTYSTSVHLRTDFSKRIPTEKEPQVKNISSKCITNKLLKFFIENTQFSESCIIPGGYYGEGGSIPIEIDHINNRMKRPATLILNDGHLRRQLPFLKKYSSKQIWEMIVRTSECKFKMNLPVRLFEKGKYHNYPYINSCCPSNLFTLVGVNASNTAKNGNILERDYEIRFDTFLGYFFIQNCVSCYTDLLPGHFYEMSSYAQLFYRLLILPYFNGAKIPMSLEEIKARLVLKSENYMCRKVVGRILAELESNRLISDPKEITKDCTYWYQYTKSDWKTIVEDI
jgi:hypothetical protein